ncbi:hypothetical protein ACJZ2D_012926 [Fusarium nematophilum]
MAWNIRICATPTSNTRGILRCANPSIHSIRHMSSYTANRITSLNPIVTNEILERELLVQLVQFENMRRIEDLQITVGTFFPFA